MIRLGYLIVAAVAALAGFLIWSLLGLVLPQELALVTLPVLGASVVGIVSPAAVERHHWAWRLVTVGGALCLLVVALLGAMLLLS